MDAAAEMGMLPDTMWELRPVDFWRLYFAHKKRERQKIRMVSLMMVTMSGSEKAADLEFENYKTVWHILTETPVKIKDPAAESPLKELTEEERQDLFKSDLAVIAAVKEQLKNG